MSAARPTPFDLVFGEHLAERFAPIREGAAAASRDPTDRDEFVLLREVVELLHELRPDEGLGEAIEALVAFLHAGYLYWHDGERVVEISRAELRVLTSPAGKAPGHVLPPGPGGYVQLPPLVVWGTPMSGGTPEPLDGWFGRRRGADLQVLALFGLRPGREGLTAVEVSGPRPPAGLDRLDGTPLFAPRVEGAGGSGAELYSVEGEEELLELAWRVEERGTATGDTRAEREEVSPT